MIIKWRHSDEKIFYTEGLVIVLNELILTRLGALKIFEDSNNNFMPTTNLCEIKHEGKKQKYFSFSFSVSDSARRDAKKKVKMFASFFRYFCCYKCV